MYRPLSTLEKWNLHETKKMVPLNENFTYQGSTYPGKIKKIGSTERKFHLSGVPLIKSEM